MSDEEVSSEEVTPQFLPPDDYHATFQWSCSPLDVTTPGTWLPSPPKTHLNAVQSFYAVQEDIIFQQSQHEQQQPIMFEIGESSRRYNPELEIPTDSRVNQGLNDPPCMFQGYAQVKQEHVSPSDFPNPELGVGIADYPLNMATGFTSCAAQAIDLANDRLLSGINYEDAVLVWLNVGENIVTYEAEHHADFNAVEGDFYDYMLGLENNDGDMLISEESVMMGDCGYTNGTCTVFEELDAANPLSMLREYGIANPVSDTPPGSIEESIGSCMQAEQVENTAGTRE